MTTFEEAAGATGFETSDSRTEAPLDAAAPWPLRYRWRLVATDTLLVALDLGVTTQLVFDDPSYGAAPALLLASVWCVALAGYRTRDPRVVGVGSGEYKSVVAATLLSFGIVGMLAVATQSVALQPFYLASLPVGLVSLLGSRWLWRRWLIHRRSEGDYLSRAIVVGGRGDVCRLIRHIERNPASAYAVVGAVLDDSDATAVPGLSGDVPALTGDEDVASIVRVVEADAVIVAGQRPSNRPSIRELGWSLEATHADLVIAPGLADVAGPRIHIRPVDGLPLMHVDLPHFSGGKHLVKRGFDLLVAATALVMLAPVLVGIAIAVKLDSRGPVFFLQERVGLNGERFRMVKFRSMVVGAERALGDLLDRNEGAGALFKIRDDPRVTPLGRILRRYSLDELPQLWNILSGEMSVVGPRPPLPREVAEYEGHVHRRLYIKPGLTGLWQVSGRSDLSWDESVRLDLYYVENWSLTGDLMIIWRTLRVLFKPAGAY